MDRPTAWELLCEYTKNENLRKHALAVEACVRAYARKFGEDEEKWSVVGLIHDFDYEIYPNAPDHPLKGSEILKEKGVSEEVRRAILATPITPAFLATRCWPKCCLPAMRWRDSLPLVHWSGPTGSPAWKRSRCEKG